MERRRQTFLYLTSLICVWSVLADNKLYGLHSDELSSGQLIVPRKVNREGAFLTHNLTHHHGQDYKQLQPRSKRSIDVTEQTADAGEDLHYLLDVSNRTLHLELEPHSYFMTPNMIIERHRRDLRTRRKPNRNANCHFHGKVRGYADSAVAISSCDGLVGHIKTKHDEYFIEPSKLHDAHPTDGHPHVVFHRSSVNAKPQTNNKTKRKNRKHKKHKFHQVRQEDQLLPQQQQQLYKRAISNCGTKEPRIRTETRLEWQPQGKVKIQGGRKLRRLRNHNQTHNHAPRREQARNRPYTLQQPEDQPQENKNQPPTELKHETAEDVATATVVHDISRNSIISSSNQSSKNYSKRGKSNSSSSRINKSSCLGVSNSIGIAGNSCQPLAPIAAAETTATTTTAKQEPEDTLARHHQDHQQQRTKRSISSPRHVEALLVADATMVAFHDDVETYLLTIMNMVSALYKDPSIGNSIEVVVVKIILLEEDEAHPDLNLTQNAQQNLDTFCSWQHRQNIVNGEDPHHHDVAILITRKNICGSNCMTLGLANVGGMCKPKRSCSVNEDNGILLSHTIAHELGHNFGMFHDTAKIGCHPRVGSIVHIMTPTFGADTLQVSWSNCSRKYITHFLDQGLGECLDNAPAPLDKYVYPEVLPGVKYNAESQCRLQFNLSDSAVGTCSSPHEICSTLWCEVNGECVTNMRPTAPGTSCGKRKWCQNGKCVRTEETTPVDGGWGNWSEWSDCSRSCGGGVSIQQRECDKPLPSNGGLFCIGERKRYQICSKEPCPEGEPSFRAKQCANFDDVPYQGGTYKWLPFFDKKNPCKLFCTDVDDTIIANWGDVVQDGTSCALGTNNMCIDGICKKVGCDWIVDSDMQEDRCGVCGGQGDQCKPVKEIFSEPFNVTEGYLEIVTIPSKARHIVIKELGNMPHFLAVGKANGNQFYLNGDSLIAMPGEFIIAGAESLYDRVDEQETIRIPQPIEHSITLYIIARGNEPNEGIYYEFTLPALNISHHKRYSWKLSNWTACSVSCGGGLQYRGPLCLENGKPTHQDHLCWSLAQNPRPTRLARSCNENPCAAHWWVGPWQYCPVTCRVKSNLTPKPKPAPPPPLRRRSVMCLDQHEIVVEDSMCNLTTRPADTEPCAHQLPDCVSTADHIFRVKHL